MRTKAAVALMIAAFLIGGGIALSLGRWFMHRSETPKMANTATVIQQIQTLSELVTVKYVLQKVVIFTNSSTTTLSQLPNVINLPGFDEDRVTLLSQGVVKAGVDLAQISKDDVQAAGNRILIRLPHAKITDSYLDEPGTQVLDRRTGLFRTFDKTLEQKARQYARVEMTRAARQSGIEREAEERAHEQLRHLLRALGFTEIEFRPR